MTLGEISNRFAVSRFAVRKHLNVLEAVRLVVVRRIGRERWNHLNVVPLQDVYERCVTPCHRIWAGSLSRALNPGVSLDLQGTLGVAYGPAVSIVHLECAVPH